MSLGNSIRHGTKWLFTGNMGGQALQFAFGIILARLLTPGDFGLLVTTQIFTGFVGMVASGGMGEALVQAREVREEDFQTVFTFQLVMGVLIYASFFLIAPWFALWFHQPLYENLLRVSALSFLLRPFANNPHIRLRRAMRFKEVALIGLVNIIVGSCISIALAANGFGVWSMVLSGLLGIPINVALLTWRAPWRPRLQYRRSSAKALSSYGFKSIANDLLVYFRAQTSNFILSKFHGPTEVGLFNKGSSLAYMPSGLVVGSTYQTIFRALSKVQDDLNLSQYIYFRTITLAGLYVLPIYIALAWVAESFVVGVYGNHWREASAPLQILCVAAPAFLLELISGALVAARNRLGEESKLQLQTWLLLIVFGLIGNRFGTVGIAWAIVAVSYYIAIRLSLLALNSIDAHPRDVLRALAPVLRLCAMEAMVLGAVQLLLASTSVYLPPLLHGAIVSAAGLFVYAALFLFYPPPALINEANRWRGKMRLKELGHLPSADA